MCGIAGFSSFKENYLLQKENSQNIIINMRKSIEHRGGDQNGEYIDENIALGHSRLSIRDIDNAIQPMKRTVGGNDYVIVYNGEIYNSDELALELKKCGYKFKTTGDTEVILYGYIEYGAEIVKKLNGIFAFSIWDSRKKSLFLFRDFMGVKPLFYSIVNNTLIFGSEIKALFCHPYVKPVINDDSFRQIFGLGPARIPGKAVFKNINELHPACFAVWSANGFKEECYWKLKAEKHYESYSETVDNVSYLVRDAIKRQMVSDIPVCCFLSGGIDSSIVTAVASDYMNKRDSILNTFSFDFSKNDEYFKANSFQPTRDRPFVDSMLKKYNLNHTYLECDEKTLVDLLEETVLIKDLPGMTDVDSSLMYFCRLVKKQNKVVLTGECADEIFGGYPWFYREDLFNANGFPWSFDLSPRKSLLKDEFIKKLDIDSFVKKEYDISINDVPRLDGENKEENRRREISYLNMRWFMATLLERMDRTSMSCGLEARVPFADIRIVEYLYNVPWSMKYQNSVEKTLLRDAVKDLLPKDVLNRKKSPYPKTYNPDYEKLLSIKFNKILNDKNQPVNEFIDKNKADVFLKSEKDYGKPWFGQLMAGPQMLAYIIQINYWLKQYS